MRFSEVVFPLSTLSIASYKVLPPKLRCDGSETDDVTRDDVSGDKFSHRRHVQPEGWFQTIRFGQEKFTENVKSGKKTII